MRARVFLVMDGSNMEQHELIEAWWDEEAAKNRVAVLNRTAGLGEDGPWFHDERELQLADKLELLKNVFLVIDASNMEQHELIEAWGDEEAAKNRVAELNKSDPDGPWLHDSRELQHEPRGEDAAVAYKLVLMMGDLSLSDARELDMLTDEVHRATRFGVELLPELGFPLERGSLASLIADAIAIGMMVDPCKPLFSGFWLTSFGIFARGLVDDPDVRSALEEDAAKHVADLARLKDLAFLLSTNVANGVFLGRRMRWRDKDPMTLIHAAGGEVAS